MTKLVFNLKQMNNLFYNFLALTDFLKFALQKHLLKNIICKSCNCIYTFNNRDKCLNKQCFRTTFVLVSSIHL